MPSAFDEIDCFALSGLWIFGAFYGWFEHSTAGPLAPYYYYYRTAHTQKLLRVSLFAPALCGAGITFYIFFSYVSLYSQ